MSEKFKLTIKVTNAAFEQDRDGEIARILRAAADRIEVDGAGHMPCDLRDANGNRVGTFRIVGDPT